MDIVFIRHAEKQKGHDNPKLTELGLIQSKYLSKKLKHNHFDELYCSGMERSKQTAQIVSKKVGLSPMIEESLNEFRSGALSGDLDTKEKKRFKDLRKFLTKISADLSSNKRILIIAHGVVNRLILSLLLEIDSKNIVRFRQLETGINEVYWNKRFENWRLKYWNDINHLPKRIRKKMRVY